MAQVKVFYDPERNTLTVWFGTPKPSAAAKGPAGAAHESCFSRPSHFT